VAEQAPLPPRAAQTPVVEPPPVSGPAHRLEGGFALVRYRPLFAGAAVERVPQLAFHRPLAEIELAHADGRERAIRTGDAVLVRSNGTSRTLRARLNRRLRRGVARLAAEHADGLGDTVEIERVS
jgi:predicted molibdopterin-dependent oxidoreductase YjgC